MGIPSILFYRFVFSVIFLLPFFIIYAKYTKWSNELLGFLICTGIFFAITSMGLIVSYSYISSGVATTIHFLYPVLTAAIMMYIFNDKKSHIFLIITLLSFIGVLFLCWTNAGNLNFWGISYSLITVVTYALYIVGIDIFELKKISPLLVTFCILFVGAIIFGIYALSTTGIEPICSPMEWKNLIVLAFFLTVLSDYALILAIEFAGSTISAILGVMEPVIAVCMGVLIFNELFTAYSAIGLILVLISIVIAIVLTPEQITKYYK